MSGPRRRLLAAVREELARLGTEFSAHLQAGAAAWHVRRVCQRGWGAAEGVGDMSTPD